MATIYIDGKPHEVKDGQNLLQACLTLGFDLPYFCWHPALGSVGACRQCAVKRFRDEKDTRGEIVMACMTPADDGARISINDPEAVEFRASVIEWLMANHPHDCPVCDEGGECHLQDMTVMTGHNYREYRFRKRTHRNRDLGAFVAHEMNRCIQCYRCVRYYRDYAGGRDFNVFAAHDHVYFGRCRDGVLESEFSGNLVEICPTGVFTDKTFKKHFTRKWDLQTAPSVCVHCGLGCNTIPGSRYGELRRVRNRYNHWINGYFLCDRGRYGYEFVNSNQRITGVMGGLSRDLEPAEVSVAEALRDAAAFVTGSRKVIGIGSPRASLEANFALLTMVGPDNFYAGVSNKDFDLLRLELAALRDGAVRTLSLSETREADAVFVLGEDVTNTAPVLALNLRQLVSRKTARIMDRLTIHHWNDAGVREVAQDEKAMLYIATPCGTRLDDAALKSFHAPPDELARLGFAVASMLEPAAPAVVDLSEEERALADEIARSLKAAARPLVVSGAGCRSRAVIEAAVNVCRALSGNGRPAEIFLTVPEANSLGLAMLGAAGGLDAAAGAVKSGGADTLIILENDLFRRTQSRLVTDLLSLAKHVIAIDHLAHATTLKADIVLPAASFAESSGSLVNNEGRAQRFYRVFLPNGQVRESWRWIRYMMKALGRPEADKWHILDDVTAAIASAVPALGALPSVAPAAGFRLTGGKVPRQSHRYSGRTAIRAQINVHEPKQPDDPDTPLAFSMEGDHSQPPSALIPRFWAPRWNSVQSLNKFQEEVGGQLRGGDPGIRLIEPDPQIKAAWFEDIPARRQPENSQWQFVPLHHIFGSEELSVLSPGAAKLCPEPYVALHPEDASALGMAEGDTAKAALGDSVLELCVKILPSLPRKVAGLPVGLPGAPVLDLPASGMVLKADR
jgi:NADH-quinone oxidoreductase subunit G